MSELIDGLFEERVELERDDGVRLPAIRITPTFEAAESCHGAGVLVVAGEWGLRAEHHVRLVRNLAAFGYFVVAMDLVRGRPVDSAEDARQRAAGLDHAIAIDDLAAGLLCVKELARGRLGVVAFDLAATIALEAAAVLPHIDAVVQFGGGSPARTAHLSRMRATVLIHRAAHGERMTELAITELVARMQRSRATLLQHTYPTTNDRFLLAPRDGEDDDRFEGRAAWDRTRDFLALALTGG